MKHNKYLAVILIVLLIFQQFPAYALAVDTGDVDPMEEVLEEGTEGTEGTEGHVGTAESILFLSQRSVLKLRARSSAISGVSSLLAMPRTPFVPKSAILRLLF